MSARELLADLAGAGFEVRADGDRLRVSPRERITDGMRDALRAAKPELLELLAERASQPEPTWRAASTRYMAHHACCRICVAAGLGYGARCVTGRRLWSVYVDACSADRTAWPGRLPVIQRIK